MTAGAVIKLHRLMAPTDAAARAKCLFAARALIACLGDRNVPDVTTVHPMVGSLCMVACRVIMDEVREAQTFRGAWGQSLGVALPPPSAEEAALNADLKNGMETMRMYAVGSPLIGTLVILCKNRFMRPAFRVSVDDAETALRVLVDLESRPAPSRS